MATPSSPLALPTNAVERRRDPSSSFLVASSRTPLGALVVFLTVWCLVLTCQPPAVHHQGATRHVRSVVAAVHDDDGVLRRRPPILGELPKRRDAAGSHNRRDVPRRTVVEPPPSLAPPPHDDVGLPRVDPLAGQDQEEDAARTIDDNALPTMGEHGGAQRRRRTASSTNRLEWIAATDAACEATSKTNAERPIVEVCQRSYCSAHGCHWFASGVWKRPIDMERFRLDIVREVARLRDNRDTLCTFSQLSEATGHVSWAPLPARTALYGRPRPAVSSMNASWPAMNIMLKHDACQLPRVDEAYEHLVQLHAIAEVRGGPPGQHPVIMLRGDSIQRGTSSAWVNIFRQQPSALDRYVHEDIGYVVTAAGDAWCRGRYCWTAWNASSKTMTTVTTMAKSASVGRHSFTESTGGSTTLTTPPLFELRFINSIGEPWERDDVYRDVLLRTPQYGAREAMIFLGGSIFHSCNTVANALQVNVWAADRGLILAEDPTRRTRLSDDDVAIAVGSAPPPFLLSGRPGGRDAERSDRSRNQSTAVDRDWIRGDRDRRGYLTMVWRTFHMFPGVAKSTADRAPCEIRREHV